jgi:tetratricopeptide (TPR) repeat protein
LLLLAATGVSLAQTTKAQLEVSETFFALTASLNSCGYDAGLADSLVIRQAVRADLEASAASSPQAMEARNGLCQFWREHQPPSNPNDVTQYVSLTLELGPPPTFTPGLPDSDLPPDAAHVLGVIPLLQKFYAAAGLHRLWLKHQGEYQGLISRFHDPVADVIQETDLYLRLPLANYPGQRFVVYLEPLLDPSHVDSRNYGSDYYVVVSPGRDGLLRVPEIRHTYLHYALEPFALGHAGEMQRLEPILLDVRRAPMSTSYKNDIALMVNESLIRAIEARIAIPSANQAGRIAYVERSVSEGFIFTHYFYGALAAFEKESTSMKNAYGDLLHAIDLDRERKRARDTTFAAEATPEVISASKAAASPTSSSQLLDLAEQELAEGDAAGAAELAQRVVQRNNGGDEPGRASFILARVATLAGDMQQAQWDFEQTVKSIHNPRLLAWSHIYLGRICDIQQKREEALTHYRAALAAGDPEPDTRSAAEKGLAAPYQPRKSQ